MAPQVASFPAAELNQPVRPNVVVKMVSREPARGLLRVRHPMKAETQIR